MKMQSQLNRIDILIIVAGMLLPLYEISSVIRMEALNALLGNRLKEVQDLRGKWRTPSRSAYQRLGKEWTEHEENDLLFQNMTGAVQILPLLTILFAPVYILSFMICLSKTTVAATLLCQFLACALLSCWALFCVGFLYIN